MIFFRKAWAFFKRDMIEALSFKSQILMDGIVIFAKCLTFFYLSKLMGSEKILGMLHTSTDYFGYVLAGIALTSLQSAALESFAKAIYREQGTGTLEAILISPTSLETVVLSSLFWTSAFVLLRLVFYFATGIFFFGLQLPQINAISVIVTLILGMSALSGLGMISAGLILLLKRPDPLGRALNGLSQLLSGVYFPAALLPSWLQSLGACLPLTYLLTGMRKALFDGADLPELSHELSILAGFTTLFLPAGILFFRFSVKRLKQTGLFSAG